MELVGFLGTLVVAGGSGALLNYFLKVFGRKCLPVINKRNQQAAGRIRLFMQFVIKNHWFFGLSTAILVLAHFSTAYLVPVYSVSGAFSIALLFGVVILGAYGFYVNKNFRAPWLTVHRTLAFLLTFTVIIHILIKDLFPGKGF
jgi:hypothetical protein